MIEDLNTVERLKDLNGNCLSQYTALFPIQGAGNIRFHKFKEKYGESYTQGLAHLLFIVVSGAGYNKPKLVSANFLKSLLGNGYKDKLEFAEKLEILSMQLKPTEYFSDKRPTYRYHIRVRGRKGAYMRNKITEPKAQKRILKMRKARMSENMKNDSVIVKTESCLNDLRYAGDLSELNEVLGIVFMDVVRDNFGGRVYSYPTQLKSEHREKLRHKDYPNELLCEVDLKSSHPFLLMQILLRQSLISHMFSEDQKFYQMFTELLGRNKIDKALLLEMESSYYRGRFYEEFFLNLLEEGMPGWRVYTRQKLKDDKNLNKTASEINEMNDKELSKQIFMRFVNGGMSELFRAIMSNSKYTQLAKTINAINTLKLDDQFIEKHKIKKYNPRKNMAYILQNLEAKLIQDAYLMLGDIWGVLRHDSILCLEKDIDIVKHEIMKTFKTRGIALPLLSEK